MEQLAPVPIVLLNDVFKDLRETCRTKEWPQTHHMKASVDRILAKARDVEAMSRVSGEKPWEKREAITHQTKTTAERERVARLVAECRRYKKVPLDEALADYRRRLDTGWTGSMADAAALYWSER